MFSLFGLEKKIVAAVGTSLESFQKEITARIQVISNRITIGSSQLDKLEMSMNGRLSRLENLLADELLAKEKARDALIKKKRLSK